MLDARAIAHAVPLFNKLGVNRWQYLGVWIVTDGNYVFDEVRERMVWKFVLQKSASDQDPNHTLTKSGGG